MAADLVAAYLEAAYLVAADRVAADRVAADRVAADLVAADLEAADQVAADLEAADLVAADVEIADLKAEARSCCKVSRLWIWRCCRYVLRRRYRDDQRCTISSVSCNNEVSNKRPSHLILLHATCYRYLLSISLRHLSM